MIPDSRKLKRGLKDISPLFESSPAEPLMIETGFEKNGFQLVGLFAPGRGSQSFALSQYLASQLQARKHSASILSLNPAQKHSSAAQSISWNKFQEICEFSGRDLNLAPEIQHTLFLDFDYSNPGQFQKIIPMLSQWILLVRPEMEDLSEVYRMIKASTSLNSYLEYFLLIDNVSGDEQASRFFEKYGEIVCRRLGIHLSWLGSIHRSAKGISARLALEALFLGNAPDNVSLEKRALAEFLFPAECRQAE